MILNIFYSVLLWAWRSSSSTLINLTINHFVTFMSIITSKITVNVQINLPWNYLLPCGFDHATRVTISSDLCIHQYRIVKLSTRKPLRSISMTISENMVSEFKHLNCIVTRWKLYLSLKLVKNIFSKKKTGEFCYFCS